jgi:hypothetical protein
MLKSVYLILGNRAHPVMPVFSHQTPILLKLIAPGMGVFSPLVEIIGSLQAAQALQILIVLVSLSWGDYSFGMPVIRKSMKSRYHEIPIAGMRGSPSISVSGLNLGD